MKGILLITSLIFGLQLIGQTQQLRYQLCTNCPQVSSTTIPVGGFIYSPTIENLTPSNIASDFGRRGSNSLWHIGIDVGPLLDDADVGTRIYPIEIGVIDRVKGIGTYKVLVIDGVHNFGYGHIFFNETPSTVNGSRSGDFILKKMESPNSDDYCIIYAPTGETPIAFGEVTGTVRHPDVNNNQPVNVTNQVTRHTIPIAPIGTSGNQVGNAHIHLFNFQNSPVDNDFLSNYPDDYNSTNFRNPKNPAQFLTHDAPTYLVTFPDEIDFTYPGNSRSSIKVRASMDGETGGGPYLNSIMDVEKVQLFVKKSHEPFSSFKLFKGPILESQIVYGGDIGSNRYPSIGYPSHNTGASAVDIAKGMNGAIDEGIGSVNRTGIAPFAYSSQPYDEFYFSDIFTRLHKNNVFGSATPSYAAINEDAKYPDGKYEVFAQLTTVTNQSHNSQFEEITIDNFRPYVKEVIIKNFSENGSLVYQGKWNWNGANLILEGARKVNDALTTNELWIKIVTSEPTTDLKINILAVDGIFFRDVQAIPNTNNMEYVVSGYPRISTVDEHTLRIQASDLSGNPLQSNPSQIPTRQADGNWSPVPSTTEIDSNHKFNSGSNVCSPGGEGGRMSSSGCLYADFSVDKNNVQTSEAVTFTPVASGSGALTYNWNFGEGAIPASSTGSGPQAVLYTTGGAKSVTLQICDITTNCITEEKIGIVTVNAQPGPSTLTVDFSVNRYAAMTGDAFQLTSLISGASGTVTYNWDFGDGLSFGSLTDPNPLIRYATPGNKTIRLTVTDANGSVSKVRASWLYVNSTTFRISTGISGCGPTNGSVTLSAFGTSGGNGPPYNSYSWDFGDGSYETLTSPTVVHNYQKAGLYTVRVTVCDETGCGSAESVDCVDVLSNSSTNPLVVNFLIDGKPVSVVDNTLVNSKSVNDNLINTMSTVYVGLNRPTKFTNSSTGGGNPEYFTYNWRIDCDYGGALCNYRPSSVGPKTQEYVFKTVGNKGAHLVVDNGSVARSDPYTGYVLEVVTGMGAKGCIAEIGDISLSSTCWTASNPPVFNVPVTKNNCPVAKVTIMDMTPPGGVILPSSKVLDFSTHSQIPEFPYTSDFSIAVYQFDGVNYTPIAIETKRFTIYGPEVANAGVDQQVCLGSTVAIGTSPAEGMSYTWTTTNGAPLSYLSSTNISNPVFNGVQKGTFKYRVTVTNQHSGCTATDDVTIVVDKPEVSTANFWAKLASPLPLNVTTSGGFGNINYSWSPANFLSSSSVANPIFTSSIEGDYNYLVTVTDQLGCAGSGQISVNASGIPGNLIAKAEAYYRISLTWQDRSDNETQFLIQRSVNNTSDFSDYAVVGSNVTTYQDLNVNKEDTYNYRVRAVILSGNSEFSNVASISTSTLPQFSVSAWPIDIDEPLPDLALGVINFCDVDKDGSAELIIMQKSGVYIYKTSAGIFSLLHFLPVNWYKGIHRYPYVYPFDMDNDDDYDMIVINHTGLDPIEVFRNDISSFTLLPNVIPVIDDEVGHLDFDGDNDIDILIKNTLYRNTGNFVFEIVKNDFIPPFASYWSFGDLQVGGDMDNDGDQDIIVSQDSPDIGDQSQLMIYPNNNTIFNNSFEIPRPPFPWTITGSLDLADYNKDKKLDILSSMVTDIYKNEGNNSFTRTSINSDKSSRQLARWGDFDMDNQLDFFLSRSREGKSNTLHKNSEGVFSESSLGWSDNHLMEWLDFDNDGDLDILSNKSLYKNNLSNNIVGMNSRPTQPINLCIYFNGVNATFSWDHATDAETPALGLTYNLYVKQNGQFILPPLSNIETGFRKVVERGNVSQNTSWTLKLPGTGNIEWGVQAVDNQYIGSLFAKNTISPVYTACGDITSSTTKNGRDLLVPNNCPSNTTTVSNGATLTLEAANVIRLLPGFRVLPGSFLNGRLTDYSPTENPCYFGPSGGRVSENSEDVKPEGQSEDQISIYPNPTKGNFTVEVAFEQAAKQVEISVISLSGNTIFSRRYDSVEFLMQEIDIVQFPQGVYLIRVIKDNKTVYRKVVKI